ncbi:MAG: NAD-dependent epimerase/dehydratase family protein [Clostridiales bacterium]|nr:NAD-dependent epimerase/dehydratase family protein [Clostridiales bacterium]
MNHNYHRILVTGGAGFIGSHIVDQLLEEEYDVTVFDNFRTGKVDNISKHMGKKNFSLVKGDIRDLQLVRKTLRDIDVVFHEAALASVSFSVTDPILNNDINITGTLNLLKTSSDLSVKRFIFASSAALYGDNGIAEKIETMDLSPTSPYGVSKLAGEKYVCLFNKLYGIETVALRYFNVYGPRQLFDLNNSYGGAITIFTNLLLDDKSPIIFGDGNQTRDFIYVRDVVEANMLSLKMKNAHGDVFNVGTGKSTSINEIANLLKENLNKKHIVNQYLDTKPAEIKHGYANIDKAERLLGFHPEYSNIDGIKNLCEWYKNRFQK